MKIERLTLTFDIQTDACDWDTLLDTIRDTPGVILATVDSCEQIYPPVKEPAKPQTLHRSVPATPPHPIGWREGDFSIPTASDGSPIRDTQFVYKGHDADGDNLIAVREGDVNEHLAAMKAAEDKAMDALRRDTLKKAAEATKNEAECLVYTSDSPIYFGKHRVDPHAITWTKPKDKPSVNPFFNIPDAGCLD